MRKFLLLFAMTLSVAASAQMEKKTIKGNNLGGGLCRTTCFYVEYK